MSTIGIMHKQPRVFAHDAVALSNIIVLEGAINTITPPGFPVVGSFYVAGLCSTTGGNGYGATVTITVNGSGEIDGIVITSGGQHYNTGDVLTITQPGSTNDVTFTVLALVASTAWSVGEPIVGMPRLSSNPPANGYNPTVGWHDARSFRYRVGGVNKQALSPAGIYIGVDADLTVIMEGANQDYNGVDNSATVKFEGLSAGTFLPISVLTISDLHGTSAAAIKAYF